MRALRDRLRPVGTRLSGPGVRAAFSTLCVVVVWVALLTPARPDAMGWPTLLRIPVEILAAGALVLVLPTVLSRVVAATAGLLAGVLLDLKLMDLGFWTALDRPAHPATDWPLLSAGTDYLTRTFGTVAGTLVAAGAVAVVVLLLVGVALAAVRAGQAVRRHRLRSAWSLTGLGVVWVACSALGAQLAAGQPLAAASSAALARDTVVQVRTDLADAQTFAAELKPDEFAAAPRQKLLTGLHGKDVVLAFVESYGRVALEDPSIGPQTAAQLDAQTASLAAAGWHARSAFLTSSTAGGGSWYAHSTLLSGSLINTPTRYDALLASTKTTLVRDFDRAGWTTVATLPGTKTAWPEGEFYGYSRVDLQPTLGYRGPSFGWSPVPDQFTLRAVGDRNLRPAGRGPVMLSIELTSSHNPWVPVPSLVPWESLGDGSVYDPQPAQGPSRGQVYSNESEVRAQYGLSVRYTLASLTQFLQRYGDERTVLVFLGDHQPSPVITGLGADRDVPIVVVAKDPAVLDRISSWGWQDGLRPHPDAPVWPMAAFRDRFLAAFSDPGAAAGSSAARARG